MKCADPVLCYTDFKGKRIFRNFSLATKIFIAHQHQQVFNCGKCLFCRKKRAYELACRCVLHASLYPDNCFLTLTYDEKKSTYHNNFEYSDIQKFKKRLRRHCKGKKIEIFNVHEYGKAGKKHWHLIVFNHDFPDKRIHTKTNDIPLYTSETLERLWPFGFNTLGDVSAASAMYQAQYCEKDLKNGNAQNDKKSHSKHAGIGRPYFLKHYAQLLRLGFIPINGAKLPLPRYFQRLAHKNYCHYFDKSAFFDTKDRKALYRPFKREEPNFEIATLYAEFKEAKQQKILDLEKEWAEVIGQFLTTDRKPDFINANENALHDLKNKTNKEQF